MYCWKINIIVWKYPNNIYGLGHFCVHVKDRDNNLNISKKQICYIGVGHFEYKSLMADTQ